MSPNYKVETSGGSGTSIVVSNYPVTNLVFNFRYNMSYIKYIDSFAIGVWKAKQ